MRTWIVILTVDAPITDPAPLLQDLPDNTEVFAATATGRTGIVFRIRSETLTRAHAVALNAMIDLYPQLNHTPVTTMQIYTDKIWNELAAQLDGAPLTTLLRGSPGSSPIVTAISSLADSPEAP